MRYLDRAQESRSSLKFSSNTLDLLAGTYLDLFDEIKHGEQDHQDWLFNKMADYFEDKIVNVVEKARSDKS